MCFGIRISSPFQLNTLNIPIQNIKCPKNTKNACADITLLSCVPLLRDVGLFLDASKKNNKTLQSLPSLITYPCTKHCTEQCDSWIALSVTQIGFGMLGQRHNSSFTNNGWGENYVRAYVFGVFRALNILNGYV